MSAEMKNYYEKGDYVAVNLPGHKNILKGIILSVICENKSEYYLISFDDKTLALVPKWDIVFRIL
ncbi:MAG: hypothetical protein K6T29_06365 [Peptococcaceae bacterium]|nr:hypothetical protein [Peptococcaceae bacterium]